MSNIINSSGQLQTVAGGSGTADGSLIFEHSVRNSPTYHTVPNIVFPANATLVSIYAHGANCTAQLFPVGCECRYLAVIDDHAGNTHFVNKYKSAAFLDLFYAQDGILHTGMWAVTIDLARIGQSDWAGVLRGFLTRDSSDNWGAAGGDYLGTIGRIWVSGNKVALVGFNNELPYSLEQRAVGW